MIVIQYEEVVLNTTAKQLEYIPLGRETHEHIDEVLLPKNPTEDTPFFYTKKFAGRDEYRWEVTEVLLDPGAAPLTYRVRLERRLQVEKQYYLKNIVKLPNQPNRRRHIRSVLFDWAVVEVDFGHAFAVGKADGNIKTNKRYVDTVQLYGMSKRRLAIVTQIIPREKEDLLQVIPISSKGPDADDLTCVDVTAALQNMVNYRKDSWAICQRIQTVTASQVMAPDRWFKKNHHGRDTQFQTKIQGALRVQLMDALMHGVGAKHRVEQATELVKKTALADQLTTQVTSLSDQVTTLKQELARHEAFKRAALGMGLTEEDFQEFAGQAAV